MNVSKSLHGITLVLSTFLFMLLSACSMGEPYTIQKLANGKEIKVISIGKIFSTKEREGTSLYLRYESDIDVSDVTELEREVETIWLVFRINAENEKVHSAVIQATNTVKKFIIFSSVKNHGFVYRKNDKGVWALSD